jgi:Cu(I)/Ag(I) efflux system periplasmic protein CusF
MHFLRPLTAATLAFAAIAAATAQTQAPTPNSEGEVRKIDKAQAKLTLRHGPIVNLDMPAMTMVFKVADPSWLGTLHEGDKVRFAADKVGGVYTVTAIESAR